MQKLYGVKENIRSLLKMSHMFPPFCSLLNLEIFSMLFQSHQHMCHWCVRSKLQARHIPLKYRCLILGGDRIGSVYPMTYQKCITKSMLRLHNPTRSKYEFI